MHKSSKPQKNTTNPANTSNEKENNVMARTNTQKENATNNANISNEKENNVMAKRDTKQIKTDYKRCQDFIAKNTEVSTLDELATCLGLTTKRIQKSYEGHSTNYNRLKAKLKCNGVAKKARKKAEQEAAEAKRKASANSRQPKKKSETTSKAKKHNSVGGFVIDASISGVEGIMDDLNRICCTKCKIILTTVTIQELEKMQRFHDNDGKDARRILAMAAGDYDHFECVLIDDTVGTPDDCIIKYCADNKDDVVLLTADKTMELKARAYGIKTHFFRHTPTSFTTIPQTPDDGNHTLHAAREINGKLYICDFENESRSIRVFSNGFEYSSRTIELKIGDDVYIATKKFDYVTFAHYQITSLSRVSNCISVYHKRLYDPKEINDLPAATYKSFMREFKRKVNF